MSDSTELEKAQDPWPTEYLSSSACSKKVTDEVLADIIERVAHTNASLTEIVQSHDIKSAYFYQLQSRYPRLAEAYEIAKEIRRERLQEEMLSIAVAPIIAGDKEEAGIELAHRRLKMQARKDLAKTAKPAKGMEKFTLNVGSKTDQDGKQVTVVQVNYGDK